MKLFRFVFLLFLMGGFAGFAFAQAEEKKPQDNPVTGNVPGMKSRLFEVKHREPSSLADALKGLASPSGLVLFNSSLRTLTVRDFPENIVTIEDALKRLDTPEAASVNLEVTLQLLKGTQSATDTATFPASLQPVLKQLQGTLKFQGYQFITTLSTRGLDGRQLDGTGVVVNRTTGESSPKSDEKNYIRYKIDRIRMATDGDGREVFQLTGFNFSIGLLVNNPVYLGFNTSLSLREGEQVVVGTTNIGDEAIIIVISVKKVK